MKLLPVALLSFCVFTATGCSQINQSVKNEGASEVVAKQSEPVATGRSYWKWIAGAVVFGLILNEFEKDDGTDGGGGGGTNGGGA